VRLEWDIIRFYILLLLCFCRSLRLRRPALTLPEALELHAGRVIALEQPGEGTLRQLGGLFGVVSPRPAPQLG